MSKRILNSLLAVSVLVLIGAAVMLIFSFISLRDNMASVTEGQADEEARYHIMVIIDGDNDDYVNQFKAGTEIASSAYNVIIEHWDFSGPDKEELIAKQFDTGVYSSVDGIIVDTYDSAFFMEVLKRANAKHIPVVTMNENLGDIEKVSHIDMNQYNIGSRLASVLNRKGIEDGSIIVLERIDENLEERVVGLYDHLEGSHQIITETIQHNEGDIINAEGVTRQIIKKYDDISAIVCTDSLVTIGVVQGIKEANAVGDIQVIGFGFTDDIREFIEKDVIYATVVANYQEAGITAIETMVNHLDYRFVSAYQNIPIVVPSHETLDAYMEEIGLSHEKTSQED